MSSIGKGVLAPLWKLLRRLQLWFGYSPRWRRLVLPIPAGVLAALIVAVPMWLGIEIRREQVRAELERVRQARADAVRLAEQRKQSHQSHTALSNLLRGGDARALPTPSAVLDWLNGDRSPGLVDWQVTPMSAYRHRYRTRWSGGINEQTALLTALFNAPWVNRPLAIDWEAPRSDNPGGPALLHLRFDLVGGPPPDRWSGTLVWPGDDPTASRRLSYLLDLSETTPLQPVSLSVPPPTSPRPVTATTESRQARYFREIPVAALTYRGFLSARDRSESPKALIDAGQGRFVWVQAAQTIGRQAWMVDAVAAHGIKLRHPDSGRPALWRRNAQGPETSVPGGQQ